MFLVPVLGSLQPDSCLTKLYGQPLWSGLLRQLNTNIIIFWDMD